MNRVEYSVRGHLMPTHGSAFVLDHELPLAALIADVMETISTDVEVTVGGVTMHLAAWEDPDHWSDDWREKFEGEEEIDVAAFVASHVTEYVRKEKA